MLTAEGFEKKSYDDYLEELEQQARELFGVNADLSEDGPMGKFIRLQAYARAEENELAEAIYLSGSVDTAEGLALDYVVKNNGLTRLQATKATAKIDLTVTPGLTVAAGLIVETLNGIQFTTTEAATDSNNDGVINQVPAEALEAGIAGNVAAGTIILINTPIAGLTAVANAAAASGGVDQETDKELRDRHADIGANGLSSTINGIRATILEDVPAVQSVVVVENATTATDSGGRPANSFEVISYGGATADIAAAILKAKPAGVRAYGTTSTIVKDDSGQDQTIAFSIATQVPIYVSCQLLTNSAFPANGISLVMTEIFKYIGGIDADGTTYTGLGMGKSIIRNKLIANISTNVPGIDDVLVLNIGKTAGTMAASNVTITAKEVGQAVLGNVSITI